MTPKEIVLSGYQCFAEGDMEGLGKIYHPNALIKVNGDHELSGDYHGFDDFLNNFLAKIPIKFPNFDLDILNVTAEDNRVHCSCETFCRQFRFGGRSHVCGGRWIGNRIPYCR